MPSFTRRTNSAALAFMVAGAVWFLIGTLYGLVAAIHLVAPEFFNNIPCLVFGRTRPVHVNTVLFGFVRSTLIGCALYYVPALLRTRLWSERLGWVSFCLWNADRPQRAADVRVRHHAGPRVRRVHLDLRRVHPAGHARADLQPGHDRRRAGGRTRSTSRSGTSSARCSGRRRLPDRQRHVAPGHRRAAGPDGLGLPLVLRPQPRRPAADAAGASALAYFVIPRVTRTPLYSHTLSLVGFWTLVALYTHIGGHHILQAPIPNWLKTISVVDSMAMIVPVFTVLANLWLTARGRGGRLWADPAGRFVMAGTIWYLITCMQGPLQSLPSVQKITHFTNWAIGHAHIAVLGLLRVHRARRPVARAAAGGGAAALFEQAGQSPVRAASCSGWSGSSPC